MRRLSGHGISSQRIDLLLLALVVAIAAGLRVAWSALAIPPFLDPDSVGYVLPAYDLIDRGNLTVGVRRTAGYPLFAAAVLALSGNSSIWPIVTVQHVLGCATAGLTFLLGRMLFSRAVALVAGVLVAVDGALLFIEHWLLTESLFAFLLVLSSMFLVRGLARNSLSLLACAGLALGALTLVRPLGQIMTLAVLAPVAWLAPTNRRRVSAIVVLLATFLLVVLPWVYWNWVTYGLPALSVSGRFMVHRALGDDDLFIRWANLRTGLPDDPLRRAALAILIDEDRKTHPDSVTLRFRNELGLDEVQADPLLRGLTLGAIRADPPYFIVSTLGIAWGTVATGQVDIASHWRHYREIGWGRRGEQLLPSSTKESFPAAQVLAEIFDPGRFGPAVAVLFALSLLSPLSSNRSRGWIGPALMTLAGILGTAAIGGLEWRYRFGFDPLLLLGASAGGGVAINQVARLLTVAKHRLSRSDKLI